MTWQTTCLSVCLCISQRGREEKTWNTAGKEQTWAAQASSCELVNGTMMIYTNKRKHVNSWTESKRSDKVQRKWRTKWQCEAKPHHNPIGGRQWKAKVTRWVSKAFTAHLGNQVRAPKLRTRLQSAGGLGDGGNDSDVIRTNNEALSTGDDAGSETQQWVDSFLQQVRIC